MKRFILAIALVLAPALSFASQAEGLSIDVKPSADQFYRYSFGTRFVHSSSYMDLTLTANGPQPTNIRSITWTGAGWQVYTNCPVTLYPGQQCMTRMVFQPPWTGSYFSDLVFDLYTNRIIVRFDGWAR